MSSISQQDRLPLVFLHGFLGNRSDWASVLSHLPPWPSYCLDLPGHGNKPFTPTFDFDPPAPKFHLIGYSMGGRFALQYALQHPERIATLMLVSTHPGIFSVEEKRTRMHRDAEWAALLQTLPIDEFLHRWYDQSIFAGFKPDFSMRRKQNIQGLVSALTHYSLGRQKFLFIEKAIHVVGEKDLKFRALHPNALVIPNAGHLVPLENPKALAKVIVYRT